MAAAFMAVSMNAQVFIGGGVGFESVSHNGNSETYLKVLPEIGYVLNEDWALGIGLGYTQFDSATPAVKATQVTVNPYARYTFASFDHVNLFIDGGFGFTNTDYDAYKNNTWSIGLKPGVAINLNDKVSFVAHAGFFGYASSKDDTTGAKATNVFGLDLDGSNLSFGFYYNF